MRPKHVGIIPDGNRRWAKLNSITEYLAHSTSGNYNNLSRLFYTALEEGVEIISLWAFSTENWKRDKKEINELFGVIERGLDSFYLASPTDQFMIKVIGKRENIPSKIEKKIKELEEETKNYTRLKVILGIDYGGMDEIIRGVNIAIKEGRPVNENIFRGYLYTSNIPNPDLIIRTGGEKRLSGYMPFQSTYSELIFLDKLFPDFTPQDLIDSINEFENRKRRFGE